MSKDSIQVVQATEQDIVSDSLPHMWALTQFRSPHIRSRIF